MYIKAFALAAVVIAVSAPVASAQESYFVCTAPIERGTIVDLGLVRAEADGVVEIYDYRMGERGELLGSVEVHEGANREVRVRTQQPVNANVLAELKVDGETVTSMEFPICHDE